MRMLKELRENKKVFQKDVAQALGVDRTTYVKYERGDSEPSIEMINKLADYFEVSVDQLMGRSSQNSAPIRVMDENHRLITLDDDALELIDSLRSRPEMKMLFSVSKKATAEDIIKTVKIIEALRDESEQ